MLHLFNVFVLLIHLLIKSVDGFILECVITVLGVKLLNERLQLLLLGLYVDGIAFEVLVLLFL